MFMIVSTPSVEWCEKEEKDGNDEQEHSGWSILQTVVDLFPASQSSASSLVTAYPGRRFNPMQKPKRYSIVGLKGYLGTR